MVEAAAGGGGGGRRIVREREGLARAYATCQAEAGAAFGSSELYLEKFVEEARHVEIQVLGDKNGMRVHLGERDCTVQRRHQKLLEESPAPALAPETRARLYKAALPGANAVNYVSAGAGDVLGGRDDQFYFLGMDTPIHVGDPGTAVVTRADHVPRHI